MSHATLADDGLLGFVVLLTLLLMTFLYAVIRAPLEPEDSPEPPVIKTLVLSPPAPPALPARSRPQAAALPAGPAGQYGDASYAARHATAVVAVIRPPAVSGGPPWGPAPKPPGLVR
jgi:hypothetical protein